MSCPCCQYHAEPPGWSYNQFHQLFQNQNFGGFPNQMFMPQTGMPANSMPVGGPPTNFPFGSSTQLPMLQGNFAQPPAMGGDRQEQGHPPVFISQGFGNTGPPHGDGGDTQFNSGQFNQGSSSFRGGKRHHPAWWPSFPWPTWWLAPQIGVLMLCRCVILTIVGIKFSMRFPVYSKS
jgi:hypothetical protein